MARSRRVVRQMPKIYGNLHQEPKRSYGSFFATLKTLFWYGMVLFIVYALFFSNWLAIKNVEVQGATFTTEDQIKSEVPLGSNLLRFSKDQVVNHILQQKEIESVAIFRGLPNSLKIVVTERKPALGWISGDTITIVDADGIPFLNYPVNALPSPETKIGAALQDIPRVTDTKSLPVSQEGALVSKGFVSFIDGVIADLAFYLPEVELDHLEIADSTSDLTYIAKSGLQVQFNTLGDSGVQVRNLTRLIHQKKATLTSKVDLRIDRWAYVTP